MYNRAVNSIVDAERPVTRLYRRNTPTRPPMNSLQVGPDNDYNPAPPVDIGEYLQKLERMQNSIDRTDIGVQQVLNASVISEKHAKLKDKMLLSFIDSLATICKRMMTRFWNSRFIRIYLILNLYLFFFECVFEKFRYY